MRIDAHQDLLYHLSPYPVSDEEHECFARAAEQTDMEKIRDAGINIVFSALFASEGGATSLRDMADHHRAVAEKLGIRIVKSKEDAKGIKEGELRFLLHIEGFSGAPDDVDHFYEKGVRSIGITHNKRNDFASGSMEAEGGLTDAGKIVFKKCEEKGMVVDLAHLNEKSFYDAIRIVTKPYIVSHANCRALCESPRNITDAQIKEIRSAGGVVGVFFSDPYIKKGGGSSIEDVVAHIQHIASVGGVDHVGIGSDFGGIISGVPKGLENARALKSLEEGLEKGGFHKEEIRKIMGENFFRVLLSVLH